MSHRSRKHKYPPFVMVEKTTLQRKEWKELSHTAKLIYIYLKANYNGGNNGQIQFKYHQYKDEFSPTTISKALKELVSKGWLERAQYGGMFRFYCLYKLSGKYDTIRGLN